MPILAEIESPEYQYQFHAPEIVDVLAQYEYKITVRNLGTGYRRAIVLTLTPNQIQEALNHIPNVIRHGGMDALFEQPVIRI